MSDTTIPEGVKKPQDRKPKTPVQVEADGDPTIDVEWRDRTWTVPATVEDWPVTAMEHYEMNRGTLFLKELLGPAQWATFTGLEPPPRNRDINALATTIQRGAGYGEGE